MHESAPLDYRAEVIGLNIKRTPQLPHQLRQRVTKRVDNPAAP